MTREAPLARAEERLAAFPRLLREAGLPLEPTRAADFLRAVTLVPLHSLDTLRRIGRITLARTPDDIRLHDRIFAAVFLGEVETEDASSTEEEGPAPSKPPTDTGVAPPRDGSAKGVEASADEARTRRGFGPAQEDLRGPLRRALHREPPIASRRWLAARNGPRIDLRATARAARATHGEALRLLRRDRQERPRRLLLLVDISGSMKTTSEAALRFAHALVQERPRVEVFCFGTTLTRITGGLRHRDADAALARLAGLVFDFDAGTRIGAALDAFLAVSRHAAMTRGADILIVSDGLETGDPTPMAAAMARLGRLGHRLVLLTPLAADPRYEPRTRALRACLPALDAIGDASTAAALIGGVSMLGRITSTSRGRATRLPLAGDPRP